MTLQNELEELNYKLADTERSKKQLMVGLNVVIDLLLVSTHSVFSLNWMRIWSRKMMWDAL